MRPDIGRSPAEHVAIGIAASIMHGVALHPQDMQAVADYLESLP